MMRSETADVKSEKHEVRNKEQEARSEKPEVRREKVTGAKALVTKQKGAYKIPSRRGWLSRHLRDRRGVLLSFFFLLFIIPAISNAQNIPDQPTGHVNDFANLLTPAEQQRLETKLRNYRDTTTTVIAIATINSLDGRSIQQVGTQLFNKWNLWQGDKDNGVLILIAKKEHRMRIDVGYGLEGAIPDIMAGRIIRNVLNPAFKKGQYYAGLDQATSIMIDLARGEYKGNLTKKRSSDDNNTASVIIFFLFIAYVIYASSRKGGGKNGGRRRRTLGPGGFIFLGGGLGGHGGGFGSGGGGGGFGGFSGGGGFGAGGGGASGGW